MSVGGIIFLLGQGGGGFCFCFCLVLVGLQTAGSRGVITFSLGSSMDGGVLARDMGDRSRRGLVEGVPKGKIPPWFKDAKVFWRGRGEPR